jgi:hypothetical protein
VELQHQAQELERKIEQLKTKSFDLEAQSPLGKRNYEQVFAQREDQNSPNETLVSTSDLISPVSSQSPFRQHNLESSRTLLTVHRPIYVCERCRRAKIKCDGAIPACGACCRSNRAQECSNPKNKISKRNKQSYSAALETRINYLKQEYLSEADFNHLSPLADSQPPKDTSQELRTQYLNSGDQPETQNQPTMTGSNHLEQARSEIESIETETDSERSTSTPTRSRRQKFIKFLTRDGAESGRMSRKQVVIEPYLEVGPGLSRPQTFMEVLFRRHSRRSELDWRKEVMLKPEIPSPMGPSLTVPLPLAHIPSPLGAGTQLREDIQDLPSSQTASSKIALSRRKNRDDRHRSLDSQPHETFERGGMNIRLVGREQNPQSYVVHDNAQAARAEGAEQGQDTTNLQGSGQKNNPDGMFDIFHADSNYISTLNDEELPKPSVMKSPHGLDTPLLTPVSNHTTPEYLMCGPILTSIPSQFDLDSIPIKISLKRPTISYLHPELNLSSDELKILRKERVYEYTIARLKNERFGFISLLINLNPEFWPLSLQANCNHNPKALKNSLRQVLNETGKIVLTEVHEADLDNSEVAYSYMLRFDGRALALEILDRLKGDGNQIQELDVKGTGNLDAPFHEQGSDLDLEFEKDDKEVIDYILSPYGGSQISSEKFWAPEIIIDNPAVKVLRLLEISGTSFSARLMYTVSQVVRDQKGAGVSEEDVVLINRVAKIIALVDPFAIHVSQDTRLNWMETIQSNMEDATGEQWNWWPLTQPRPRSRPGYGLVRWKCVGL